jgi:Domain of unknown function (DUF4192)
MDAPTDPALDDDAGTPPYRVQISDPGEIAAALPYLLGFHPRESVVLVSLGGPSGGRLGLTVRADLPPPEHAAAVAGMLARGVATDHPAGVLVLVVSEAPDEPATPLTDADEGDGEGDCEGDGDGEGDGDAVELPHRGVLHDVVLALAAAGIPVRDSLLVRGGRWWSYECPHPCCAPGGGTPLPSEPTELAVASVATGQVVEQDRGSLTTRIARITGPAADEMMEVTWRVGARYARDTVADEARTARQSWTVIRRAVARCRPGTGSAAVRLPAREVARVLWALSDVYVRDRALGLALGADAPAAEVLWTECTRRAPEPLDAAPATLLAVSAWLRGDGAMANVALERALTSDPGYALADLLAQGLAACLPPAQLRTMVRATVADLERSGR